MSLKAWVLGRGALLTILTITANTVLAWDGSVAVDVASPFVQGDPVMSFSGAVSYTFNPMYSVSLLQGVEKNFYIDSATKEFELADSVLAFTARPRSLITNVSWTMRLSASLPTSTQSQQNEIYSKPEARWTAAYPLTDRLQLALNAFVRYPLSRYDTTKPQDGSGGNPLPEMSYGFGHSGSWTLIPNWVLSYGVSYSEIRYHTVTYEGPGPATLNLQPDQAYSLSLGLGWTLGEQDSLSFSYSYGGILQQPGLDDYVLYDKEESRWAVGYAHDF